MKVYWCKGLMDPNPQVFIAIGLILGSVANAGAVVDLADIQEAFKHRADSFPTVQWFWSGEKMLHSDGAIHEDYPATPTTMPIAGHAILMADGRQFVERWYTTWNASSMTTTPDAHSVSIYDGSVSKSYWEHNEHGNISAASNAAHAADVKFIACNFMAEPYFLGQGSKLARVEPGPGGDLIIIKYGGREFVLDQSLDFSLVGWRSPGTDGSRIEVNIEYVREFGYTVPKSFSLKRWSSSIDQLVQTEKFDVEMRFEDSIEDNVFVLDFPKGTYVYDEFKKTEYVQGGPVLKVHSDKPISHSLAKELASITEDVKSSVDSGDELVSTEIDDETSNAISGEQNKAGSTRAYSWIIGAGVFLTMACVASFALLGKL